MDMLNRDILYRAFLPDGFTNALRIIDAGYEDFKTRKPCYQARKQNNHILHVVLSGQGTFISDAKTYALSGGDMFLCYPQAEICYYADKINPYRYCWFSFQGEDAPSVCRSLALTLGQAAGKAQNRDYVAQQFTELFRAKSLTAAKIKSIFYTVIAALEQSRDREQGETQVEMYAARIRRYLNDNFMRPELKIEHIARFLNISHVYLCKLFKRAEGVSAMQYLKELRLGSAYRQLILGGHTVTEAMYDSGYTDISYFSKEFKAKYGFSPGKLIRK